MEQITQFFLEGESPTLRLIMHFKTYCDSVIYRSIHRRCSIEEGVLENFANFTGKHVSWSHFVIKLQPLGPATILKKTPTQVFSCEICEIFKNTYFEEHQRTTASLFILNVYHISGIL